MDHATREEERRAAERALDQAAASWDATAMAIVSGLPSGVGERIRGLLVSSLVGQTTFDEVARGGSSAADLPTDGAWNRTSEAVRRATLFVSRLVLTSDAPGGPAAGDARLNAALEDHSAPFPFRAVVSAISVARATDVPLYSDDRAVRTLARSVGVSAFGTVALLEVLAERREWSEEQTAAVRAELTANGAWGLGMTPNEFIDTVRARGFYWDTGVDAVFSDLLAHHLLPRGLIDHGAAILVAVSMEAPDRVHDWAPKVVNAFANALGQTRMQIVWILLGFVFDLTDLADPTRNSARARVIRALRQLPYLAVLTRIDAVLAPDSGPRHDPLIVLVDSMLRDLEDESLAPAALRLILRQVDDADRHLLLTTFTRHE